MSYLVKSIGLFVQLSILKTCLVLAKPSKAMHNELPSRTSEMWVSENRGYSFEKYLEGDFYSIWGITGGTPGNTQIIVQGAIASG